MVGTIIGIGGAMVMTFYKGIQLKIWSSHINLSGSHQQNSHVTTRKAELGRQVLGVVCAFGSSFSYAIWLIIQGLMSKDAKEYPSHYSSTALMCTMAAIQSTVFALCVEREWRQWKLGWNVRLLTVVYSGIVASGAMVIAIAWCVEKRGPLFVSIFSPLMLVLVVILASLTLAEKLYLGSVLGSALIVCGLYMVLWGKKKEAKMKSQPVPFQISLSQVVDLPPPNDDDKNDHINVNFPSYIAKDHQDSPTSTPQGHYYIHRK
ncbi:hypothetical protein RIF29_41675 [Crotalaria pallida]|uniref:WAT1-related protein n=1 Tax=Crotalaria pallida TaxID=3830 RepID=A0AAN9EB09_CROPI